MKIPAAPASSFILLLLILLKIVLATDHPDCKHATLTVCDGGQATFSWPCDVPYDLVDSMTLTNSWSGREGGSVATIFSNGSVSVAETLSDRITVRGTTGVHMSGISIRDAGTYLINGQYQNGTSITTHYISLSVHVPPLLESGELRLQMSNISKHCQALTCGSLVFQGYPPVSLTWKTPVTHQTKRDPASGDGGVVKGCPLAAGTYTCHMTGEATHCLGQESLVEKDVFVNISWVKENPSENMHNTLLIITVSAAAVLFPLIILALWVLSHMLTKRPTYRELQRSSSSELERGTSTSSRPGSPTPPLSPSTSASPGELDANSQNEEDGSGEEEDDDDQTTPMVKPVTERGSESDNETRI